MDKTPLFRTEAIHAHRTKWIGEIVLIKPLSFTFLTTAAVAVAVLTGAFLVAASYIQRQTVTGILVPDIGIVKVYAPQSGIVIEKLAGEGQIVNQGDLLYMVSSDRQSSAQSGTQAVISQRIFERERSLRAELIRTRQLQQVEGAALRRKLEGLRAEAANIERQILGQRNRVELAADAIKRSGQLVLQGFISKEMMQQKQADLLDQRNRLQAIERDQISVAREMASQQQELDSLEPRQQNQRAQIERVLASTSQEWTESEARRRLAITAPESGIVTAITAEAGQNVDVGKSMVSIVPHGATLQAHLYAPSRAIGFVKPGDQVLIRYQAFPYQKFGHAQGIVLSVSRAALTPNEVTSSAVPFSDGREALYRITVKLERQTLDVYGKRQLLQPGMLLEADILQEKRRLYEWVLEPLYSLTGKL